MRYEIILLNIDKLPAELKAVFIPSLTVIGSTKYAAPAANLDKAFKIAKQAISAGYQKAGLRDVITGHMTTICAGEL